MPLEIKIIEADPPVAVGQGQDDGPALSDGADPAFSKGGRNRGAVSPHLILEIGVADAVGATEMNLVGSADPLQFFLKPRSFGTGFGESAGKGPGPVNSFPARFFENRVDLLIPQKNGDAVNLHLGRDCGERRITGASEQLLVTRVDGNDFPLEPESAQVVNHQRAGSEFLRGAHDGDGFGFQKRIQVFHMKKGPVKRGQTEYFESLER